VKIYERKHFDGQTLLLESEFSMCRTANESNRLDSNASDTAVCVRVQSSQHVAGKSVKLAEYFGWLAATSTAKQLQQTYNRQSYCDIHYESSVTTETSKYSKVSKNEQLKCQ